MKNIIEMAQYRIRKFAEVNNINLNEEMLRVPITPAKEYAKEKEYTIEEVKKMLNGSEAVFISLVPLVPYMEIIYDEDKLESNSVIDAEDEALSFVIAFEYEKVFEEGLTNCMNRFGIEKLLEMYNPVLALQMAAKFKTMTIEDARRWLE